MSDFVSNGEPSATRLTNAVADPDKPCIATADQPCDSGIKLPVCDDAVPDERVMDSLMDFDSILQSAFSASGKGFYECREEIRESDRQWWVVRHHHGPWM